MEVQTAYILLLPLLKINHLSAIFDGAVCYALSNSLINAERNLCC